MLVNFNKVLFKIPINNYSTPTIKHSRNHSITKLIKLNHYLIGLIEYTQKYPFFSKTDFLDIVLYSVKQNPHVLSFRDRLCHTLVRSYSRLCLALTAIRLVTGLAFPAVNVPTFLQPYTILDDLNTVIAGKGVHKGLEGSFKVGQGLFNQKHFFVEFLPFIPFPKLGQLAF